MSEFVTVAKVDEIAPGERIVVEIGRDWVVVFNVGGEFYAINEICSHEEYSLAEGELDGYTIECPKHGAQFDIRTGQHLCPPAVSPVKRYAVRVQGDNIQVEKGR
jgi:3-phenylpropionate/trans-cinnamate dioxygenase ferredoxin subunit